jgi:leucyl aminopeptidase
MSLSDFNISVETGTAEELKSDLIVCFLGLKKAPFKIEHAGTRDRIREIGSQYSDKISRDEVIALDSSFKTGRMLLLNARRIKYQSESEKLKSLCAMAVHTAESMGCRRIHILLNKISSAEPVAGAAEGLGLGMYSFDTYKTSKEKKALDSAALVVPGKIAGRVKKEADKTLCLVRGVNLARQLVNEPGNVATTDFMVRQAKSVAKKRSLRIKILGKNELKKEKCNGLLNVGAGGSTPPAMVLLEYSPRGKARSHTVLVGKGICFDSGGICIKSPDDMWEMKTDMSGAATVLGIMDVIGAQGCPHRITGILCLAENSLDRDAYRPGDIFYAKNGKTVMVENTDAEGRLVLSDGLCMAGEIGATHVIDFATLTGACVVALGEKISAIMSNYDPWLRKIAKFSSMSGENCWQLPLLDEYRALLDTPQADIRNVGGRAAGAITAGIFLKEFVDPKIRWAHMDIAGTNYTKKPWRYFREGATGVGIRPVVKLLQQNIL